MDNDRLFIGAFERASLPLLEVVQVPIMSIQVALNEHNGEETLGFQKDGDFNVWIERDPENVVRLADFLRECAERLECQSQLKKML